MATTFLKLSPLEPREWVIELDSFGSFKPEAPSHYQQGNYRIKVQDTLSMVLPSGGLVNQDNVRLRIKDGQENISYLQGQYDFYGNCTFCWKPVDKNAGSATLTVEYEPFVRNPPPAAAQQQEIQDDPKRSNEHPLISSAAVAEINRYSGVDNEIIVEPRIYINGVEVAVSSLCMQTILSKCLGKMDTWSDQLQQTVSDLNYNAIHLTPVQVTGESGSCYSLANQLQVSESLVPEDVDPKAGFEYLRKTILEIEKKLNVISTSDLVLNHTANNTAWLSEHYECGYNIKNSPHLKAAIELDIALQEFSAKVSSGRYRNSGVSEHVDNEAALSNLRRLVNDVVLRPFNLHEWFQMDIEAVVEEFERAHSHSESQVAKSVSERERLSQLTLECLKTVGVKRLDGVRPRCSLTTCLYQHGHDLRRALETVQKTLSAKAGETQYRILDAIEGYVRWERIQCRKGAIGNSYLNSLVPRYFTPIELENGQLMFLANNGWVMGQNVEEDFAAPGSLVYLDRSLVAWSDCVKLRFGETRDDCPFLWDLMAEYARTTAQIFHGIRLDNCHTTPLHVAKYCLKECRKANPNIWIYAELFTGKREADLKFERELGLNALIREAMQAYNARSLCGYMEEFSFNRVGTLEPITSLRRFSSETRPVRALCPVLSPSIFYDCTHDNETPQQKRTAVDALPNAAAVAAAACSLGTSRGYDELVPKTLSVVTESRMYHKYVPPPPAVSAEPAAAEKKFPAVRISTSLKPECFSLAVRGSWDSWKTDVPLVRRRGLWTADFPKEFLPTASSSQELANLEFQFKFIADGTSWLHDPHLPHARDEHGNLNNVLRFGTPNLPLGTPLVVTDPQQWRVGKPLPGIMEARKVLNDVHKRLGNEGFTELNAFTVGEHLIIATRHEPLTHRSCVFFIHTAFSPGVLADPETLHYTHEICGKIDQVLLEARLVVPEDLLFHEEHDYINGLQSCLHLSSHSKVVSSRLGFFETWFDDVRQKTFLKITAFPPGSIFIVTTQGFRLIRETVSNAIQDLGNLSQSVVLPGTKISRSDELQAFSYLLFSCDNEERDRSKGLRGIYELNGSPFAYAGIAGVVPVLDRLRYQSNSEHPLVKNIMQGNWLFNYLADRLDTDRDDAFTEGVVVMLLKIATWLRETFREPLLHLSRHLLPYYFDWIVSALYSWVAKRVLANCPFPLKTTSDPFIVRLALATLQFYSFVPSAPLNHKTKHPSLCAGLPHFCTQYMRNWGRDTFISIKGCLMCLGRFEETREEILGYASLVRHGLIPNLLDSGNHPRYNARDATWFFLTAVQHYCTESSEGPDFLKTPVTLKYAHSFPPDSQNNLQTIADLIHFILSQHAQGINFCEWNAGPKIDSCMTPQGFNIQVYLDQQTGLIYGGNAFNCGTWMDKMGSSVEAGTLGKPATPRDGAAIEINAMAKSVLSFILSVPSSLFPYDIADPKTNFSYVKWHQLLEQNLEKTFYVASKEPFSNRLFIYKDTHKATDAWRDYQFRPNLCVALATAPEAFTVEKSWKALELTGKELFGAKAVSELEEVLGMAKNAVGCKALAVQEWFNRSRISPMVTVQLGLKTLDPSDYQYRPIYDNDNRSTDASLAHGYSYHNGPEWVWPVGYFLESVFNYGRLYMESNKELLAAAEAPTELLVERYARFVAMQYLLAHRDFMRYDSWCSLPELTNASGEFCRFGCASQAWSVGTILAFVSLVGRTFSTLQGTSTDSEKSSVASGTQHSP